MHDEQFLTSGRPPGEDEMTSVSRSFGDTFAMSRLGDAIQWARKYSFFSYPFVTACCGMEYMSVAGPRFDLDRFGAALPRFTPRQADLLMVVGTITHRQAPVLQRVYRQMAEPTLGDVVRCLHQLGRSLQQLRRRPGHRHHHSRSTSTSPGARRIRRPCSTAASSCRSACSTSAPARRYEGRHGSGRPMQD